MKKQNGKIIGAVLLVIVFGAWLAMEITRWQSGNQMMLEKVMSQLRPIFGSAFSYNTKGSFASMVLYLLGAGLTVPLYFLAVAIPEQTGILTGKRSKTYRIAVTAVLAVLALFCLLSLKNVYAVVFPRSGITGTFMNKFYYTIPSLLGLMAILGTVASLVFQLYVDLQKTRRVWKGTDYACGSIRFILSLLLAVAMAFASFHILQTAKHFIPSIKGSYSNGSSSWDAVIATLLCAPIFEEMMFRGVILNKMRQKMPAWLALVISAVFFGLWHRNIGQFLYTMLMGLFFGYVYLSTGKIRYCIFSHMANNYLAAIVYQPKGSGVLPSSTWLNMLCLKMERISLGGHILLMVAGLAMIVGILILMKRSGLEKCKKTAV